MNSFLQVLKRIFAFSSGVASFFQYKLKPFIFWFKNERDFEVS